MGISKYLNVPSLQYADRDALSFYDYLLSPAGGKADTNNIRLLLNEKATSYNFFEAMDNLLDAAKEDDVVYIYFAGHGDIEKKTERQNGFLIGYNAPPNCYAAGGSISVRFLQDYVETLVSKNKSKVILIVDACRSGKLAGGKEGVEITALALKAEWKGVTKILSCQPGEKSLEGDNWGGGAGVFTYFMLKGMKGLADKDKNNEVTLMELSYFLDENVAKETDNKQLPEVVGDKRQDIAKVDKETYLAMLNKPERKTIIPENLSAGFEPNLNSIDDMSVLKAYERFKEYIKTENLIAYNDADEEKETALSIYRSLEGSREANPVITSMKRELLAALQNRAQKSINIWLNSKSMYSLTPDSTYQELKSAFIIIDSTYYQYEQIKFRYFLWKHLFEKDIKNKLLQLDECSKINPNDPIVNYCIGWIHYENNDFKKAYSHLSKAVEFANNWSWAWNQKGMVLSKLGKNEEAINCYNKAIRIKPDFAKSWYNKGITLGELGKYDDAIACYRIAIENEPDIAEVWTNLGTTLMYINKIEEAIKCQDKAIEIKPDYDMAWYNKGNTLLRLGKNEEAIKCYTKAIELKSDYFEAWSNKGLALLMIGKNEESIKCFDKVINMKPDYYLPWINKGISLSKLGKNEEAIKCFDKAIELKPDNAYSWYGKACCYSLLKNKSEMIKCIKRTIELDPKLKTEIKKDEDFKEYWDDADFKKLVE